MRLNILTLIITSGPLICGPEAANSIAYLRKPPYENNWSPLYDSGRE